MDRRVARELARRPVGRDRRPQPRRARRAGGDHPGRLRALGRRHQHEHAAGQGQPQAPVLEDPVPGRRADRRARGDRRRPLRRLQGLPVQVPLREGSARLPPGRRARGPDAGGGGGAPRAGRDRSPVPGVGRPRPGRGAVAHGGVRGRHPRRRGQQAAVPDRDRSRPHELGDDHRLEGPDGGQGGRPRRLDAPARPRSGSRRRARS